MDQDSWEIPERRRLPGNRESITHEVNIAGVRVVLTVGLYAEGLPGEILINASNANQDELAKGVLNAWARSYSQLLQYGVPLADTLQTHKHSRFQPMGFTSDPSIHFASSIVDYVARWLELRFIGSPDDDVAELEPPPEPDMLPDGGSTAVAPAP